MIRCIFSNDSLVFFNREDAVDGWQSEFLDETAGPVDLYGIYSGSIPQAEMNAHIVR
jgi:hypothetical protein